MKVRDTVPVTIAGQVVAQATVKEIGDGTVTLIVPGTLVVMATRTELAVDNTPADTTGTETLITGVDRSSGESATVDVQTNPQAEVAPVAATEVAGTATGPDGSVPDATPSDGVPETNTGNGEST